MYALISPNENNRIAEVASSEFPVAEPLFWVECAEDVTTEWTYVDGQFLPPVIPVPTAEENKQTAISLLADTDWVNQPDVRNTAVNPHLLNGPEFDTYRVAVRQYAVYPVEGDIVWPIKPTEQWSN